MWLNLGLATRIGEAPWRICQLRRRGQQQPTERAMNRADEPNAVGMADQVDDALVDLDTGSTFTQNG
jgi:hypothetical protein